MPEADLETTYRAIRHGVAWRVVPRDAVLVDGPDATSWLQGQISQDLDRLGEVGTTAETLVLSPQGKIDSYCRVTRLADAPARYLLDVKAGAGGDLYERLRRFRLRVKATVVMLEGVHVLEQRGPASKWIGGAGEPGASANATTVECGIVAKDGAEGFGGLVQVPVSWPGLEGSDWLFIGDPSKIPAVADSLGVGAEPGDERAFEAARIEAGAPELGRELTERTIPQEAADLVARTVSFTKGCYTGQELVARIDARGSNTPRRLRGLVIEGATRASGAGLGGTLITQGEKAVGEVTSAAWSPGLGLVALAYLKRGVTLPAEVSVVLARSDDDGAPESLPGTARELPLAILHAAGELP
jgi:folate-binding protein YgfZ